MPRKKHKYHFIYKTTCLLNEKYYIGMHSTSNLEDDYLGSGKKLRYSVKKYGKENFKREILEFFESKEDLKKREAELVNDDLLNDPNCMNLQYGGGGGLTTADHAKKFHYAGGVATYKILHERLQNDKTYRNRVIENIKSSLKSKIDSGWRSWEGKHHSEDTKKQMSSTHKENAHQQGIKNSQYGSHWITNGVDNIKCKSNDIPMGWRLGRTINKSKNILRGARSQSVS